MICRNCGCDSGDRFVNLYGIRQDGSVVMNQYDWYENEDTVTIGYRDWKLQELYAGNGGVVGLTTDGRLVGDGIYADISFSEADR